MHRVACYEQLLWLHQTKEFLQATKSTLKEFNYVGCGRPPITNDVNDIMKDVDQIENVNKISITHRRKRSMHETSRDKLLFSLHYEAKSKTLKVEKLCGDIDFPKELVKNIVRGNRDSAGLEKIIVRAVKSEANHEINDIFKELSSQDRHPKLDFEFQIIEDVKTDEEFEVDEDED